MTTTLPATQTLTITVQVPVDDRHVTRSDIASALAEAVDALRGQTGPHQARTRAALRHTAEMLTALAAWPTSDI